MVRIAPGHIEDVRKEVDAARWLALPSDVIHGDAHEGNALRDRTGTVRLTDFESFALGPREWDAGVLALRYRLICARYGNRDRPRRAVTTAIRSLTLPSGYHAAS